MNFEFNGIAVDHLKDSAGRCGDSCARSSVPINVDQLFNPAVTLPQEKPTSGLYAGQRSTVDDATATRWGLCLSSKTSPTVVRKRSQLFAEVSLRAAANLQIFSALAQSARLPSPSFPQTWFRAAPKTGAKVSSSYLPAPNSSPPGAASPPVSQPAAFSNSWHNIGDVAEKGLLTVWDAANRAKDREDEALDAMRVSNGMTLDQYLESVTTR